MTDDRHDRHFKSRYSNYFGKIVQWHSFLPFKGNNEYLMRIIQLLFSWKSIDVDGSVKRQSFFRFVSDN